jgi:hypothetical protein
MEHKMTFDQAMAQSRDLELEALRAIAYRLPEAQRSKAVSAYIQFNPYRYMVDDASRGDKRGAAPYGR